MKCRCTLLIPQCALGNELFADRMHAQQQMHTQSGESREQEWKNYYDAHTAYIDHLDGWRQGDIKVRREDNVWLLEKRQQRQWVFQFGTAEDVPLRAWLKTQGFWRYTQIDGDQLQDRTTGYYHKRTMHASISPQIHSATAPLPGQQEALRVSSHWRNEAPASADNPPRPEMDLKTRVTILIAVLIGRHAQQPTAVEQLSVQRRAIDLLFAYGVRQIEASDVHTIHRLIDAAMQVQWVTTQRPLSYTSTKEDLEGYHQTRPKEQETGTESDCSVCESMEKQ